MSPKLSFRGQPFGKRNTMGSSLTRILSDPDIDSLTMVVAWARFGGLRRLSKEIGTFRRRGGRVRLIVGIDEGIATVPGLLLAMNLADEPFVFHDRGPRTFHPKTYLAEGQEKAILAVGSSNFTAGGLFSNYEASLEAEFDLPTEAEEPALRDARDYVAKLLAEKGLCLPLTKALLERLVANPGYAISGGEGRAPGGSGRDVDEKGETGAPGEDIFGTGEHSKTSPPPLPKGIKKELARLEGKAPPTPPPALAVPAGGSVVPVLTWTKRLSASDAQHPPSRGSKPSNVIGNVRLVQAGHPIDRGTWFRRELFGPAKWRKGLDRRKNEIQVATVTFAVTIAGKSYGLVDLRVDHAPHRESGQHNHATILHWDSLASLLRATDYTDYVLTLQRLSNATYRLDISP